MEVAPLFPPAGGVWLPRYPPFHLRFDNVGIFRPGEAD